MQRSGGTAVISPVGKIVDHGKEIVSQAAWKPGESDKTVIQYLYRIQMGTEAPKDWIYVIE